MDSNTPRLPDTVDLLMKLMKDTFGDIFLQYYEGDPINIPNTNLPCIIIEKVADSIDLGPTQYDESSETITISLVMDKAADIGASDDYDLTERKLRLLVEGRVDGTGEYMEKTVLGALRSHITLGDAILEQRVEVNYDLQPRAVPEVTSQAAVTVTSRKQVYAPIRA